MSCNDPQHELLYREYDNLPALIALYGNLSWQKSQFFFTVESIAFAGVGVAFKNTFLEGATPAGPALFLLIVVCVFNFWLCYVWFNTNRRNREYLNPLVQRGRAIEVALKADKATHSAQWTFLESLPKRRYRTSWWELHIPTGFALAWSFALLTAAWHAHHFCWALGILIASLCALWVIERPK
jgi:hypothetical protein